MTKIKQFDRQAAVEFGAAIEEVIGPVLKAHGVKLIKRTGTYGGLEYVSRLTFAVEGHDPAAEDFKRYATSYGLKPEDLGKQVEIGGELFEITGILPKKRKFPIAATRISDGSKRIISAAAVKSALGRAA